MFFPKSAKKPGKEKARSLRSAPSLLFCGSLPYFLDLGGLARTTSQVVQLRPADFALPDLGDVRDLRGMDGERPLDAYAVGKPPDRERLSDAAVFLRYHDAFERLQSFARALDDFDAYFYRVAYVECGNADFEIFLPDSFDQPFH